MEIKDILIAFANGEKLRLKGWGKGIYIYLIDNKIYNQNNYEDISVDYYKFTGEWELYQELHDWNWALEQLKAGKKVKWHEWDNIYWCADVGEIWFHYDKINIKCFTDKGWVLHD